MSKPPRDVSRADARAIALAAQGLAGPRPKTTDRRMLRATLEALGVVQIDSVNVLARSHYLPMFSRLGSYDTAAYDALAHRAPRSVFEYWGHEASLLPVALAPYFRWRMARAADHAWGRMRRIAREHPGFVDEVLGIVRERGPISASDLTLTIDKGNRPRKAGWWEWSDAKTAIEFLFWSGVVTSARRRGFERLYDLPERVLPARVVAAPTPTEADACRELVERSARAMGIATEADLRDYYRLPLASARTAVAELVDAKRLLPVAVEGWRKQAYLHRDARIPRTIDAERGALLSPFDNLVWFRDRTERLFGMRYRIEIYVPAPKRVHGYYVLPFLLGDRLVARVDLKADRKEGALLVQAAHGEPKIRPGRVATALSGELGLLAAWLGLSRVRIAARGDLASALRRA